MYAQVLTTCTTGNIIMYNITIMDQYSSAFVTVPANMSSVEISQFPYNGTSIVANREYTITVSVISDQGTSYPSDPVVISKFSHHTYIRMYHTVHTYKHTCLCTCIH